MGSVGGDAGGALLSTGILRSREVLPGGLGERDVLMAGGPGRCHGAGFETGGWGGKPSRGAALETRAGKEVLVPGARGIPS